MSVLDTRTSLIFAIEFSWAAMFKTIQKKIVEINLQSKNLLNLRGIFLTHTI